MPAVAGLGFEEDMQDGWKRRVGFRVRVSLALMGCRKASIMVRSTELALGLNKSKIARELSCLSLLAFICQARSRVPERVEYTVNPSSTFLERHVGCSLGFLGFGSDGFCGPSLTASRQAKGSAGPGGPTTGTPRAISMSVAPECLAES